MKPRQLALLLVILIVPALILAACGGDGNSTGSTAQEGATDSSGETTETLVPEPPTTPPTEIGITTPLKQAPPEGKTVTFLQCEFPVCELYGKGLQEATEALGWKLQTEVFKSTEPDKALQQAIAGQPDFISMSGIPASLMKTQLAAAEKAGIPVISCGAATPEAPGEQYTVDCGHTLGPQAEEIRDWIINDSEGKANIAGVTISLYPVLTTETAVFEGSELTSNCPKCSYGQIDVTPEEVAAGAVPQKVAAYLQSHSDTDYVFLTFGDLEPGLYAALQSAGLADQAKITGVAATSSIMQQIGKQMSSWTAEGVPYQGWVMADGMARLAAGEELPSDYSEVVATNPSWTVTTPEAAESLEPNGWEWEGPEDFQAQFEELWQLTG